MEEWQLQVGLGILALIGIAALVYALVFSPESVKRAREGKTFYGGWERREPERTDRRRGKAAPPADTGERRVGPRR